MKKKGISISLFVIIGLLFIITTYLFLNIGKQDLNDAIVQNIDFGNVRTGTKIYVEICLDQVTLAGIDKYGLFKVDQKISDYIDINLLDCLNNFEVLKEQGYAVTYEQPDSEVVVNDNIVFVDLYFPVTLSKRGEQISIDDFQYTLKKSISLPTQDGIIKAGTILSFEDDDLIVKFEKDTKAYLNKVPLKDISFKLVDKNFDNLENDVVIGELVYEGLPKGATFDPPLNVNIRVNKEDIPDVSAQSLKIGFYDDVSGIWRTFKSLPLEEDENYFYYSALVDHFTPIAVVMCGEENIGTYKIPMGYVYEQLLEPANESFKNFWQNNFEGDAHEIEEAFKEGKGKHLPPELMDYKTEDMELVSCELNEFMVYNSHLVNEVEREETCNYLLKDWDNDDDPDFEIMEVSIDNIDTISMDSEDTRYVDCVSSCGELALNKFNEESTFEWMTQAEDILKYISGDGINDNAVIHCETQADSHILCVPSVDNINDKQKLESAEGLLIETMETYDGDRNRLGFFATPRTYGYGKLIEGEDEQVGGKGFFVFELAGKGNSCEDTESLNSQLSDYIKGPYKVKEDTDENLEFNACSPNDECTWFLNDDIQYQDVEDKLKENWPTGDEVKGSLIAGINVVSVNVKNLNNPDEGKLDLEAWAYEYFVLKGKGLVKWEECGVTLQDRIDYLEGCKDEIIDESDLQYKCLKELIDADETKADLSLCNIETLSGECAIFNKWGESFNPNGGFCANNGQICSDVLSETDSGCLCGEETVEEGIGYCCANILFSSTDEIVSHFEEIEKAEFSDEEKLSILDRCRQDYKISDEDDEDTETMSEDMNENNLVDNEFASELGGGIETSGETLDACNIEPGDFKPVYKGIEIKKVDTITEGAADPTVPIPIIYYVVKIDVEEEGVGFFVTPGPQELMITSDFMLNEEYADDELGSIMLAINGDGFEFAQLNSNVEGIAISDGKSYGKDIADGTFFVNEDDTVEVRVGSNPQGAKHAVSGFHQIVKDGAIVERFIPGNEGYDADAYGALHPRTSIGYNENDNQVILIVVEGRGATDGVSLEDLAKLHLEYGSTAAVNMDGGGSTTLVLNQDGVACGAFTPSDGSERFVGNHLGVYAKEVS